MNDRLRMETVFAAIIASESGKVKFSCFAGDIFREPDVQKSGSAPGGLAAADPDANNMECSICSP